MKTALVLSGGGARAAYQVGVLKAVAEINPNKNGNPFQIICGTSSGALNAAKLATHADNFAGGVNSLDLLWSQLDSQQIHKTGYLHLFKSVIKFIGLFFHKGITRGRPLSLLDNTPLKELLDGHIDLPQLAQMIEQGQLHALCITALGYTSGRNLCFFQGDESIESWTVSNRIGLHCQIEYKHILASLALPMIFPAVRINREYFGDGALRQTAPLSAALHLGAEKLFVIGVARNAKETTERGKVEHSPSLAQVMGQLVNSAFIDSLAEDIDMLQRFNSFAAYMDAEKLQEMKIRPVDFLVIEPSVKFDDLAFQYINYLPKSIRLLLRITGANEHKGGSSLASYILFEKEFCRELIRCGYQDAMKQKRSILEFLGQ